MPSTKEPIPIFDRLSESFEDKINQLCDLSSAPELFAEFMQKARPKEISLLVCTLGEYNRGNTGLAECMKDHAESEEFKEEPVTIPNAHEGASEPSALRELRQGETPAIQYSLKARLETHFEEDLERVELTLAEYETLKCTLLEMRAHA